MNAVIVGIAILGAASCIAGIGCYVKMMAGLSPPLVQMHCARLRIRANLLFLACPELFVGKAATWRRLYIAAALCFMAAMLAAGALGSLR